MARAKQWSIEGGRRRSKRRYYILAAVIGMLIALAAAYILVIRDSGAESGVKDQKSTAAKNSEQPATTKYTSAKGRYLFNGTIAWDRALETSSKNDINWLFSKLDTFDRSKYDAWIADLECPVTNKVIPYQTQVDSLIFNCPPKFIEPASKYFDIVNLANNHTGDLSRESFYETQKHLVDGGLQSYGDYDMSVEENRCEVIAMPVRLQKAGGGEDKVTIPIAYCAYHAVSRVPTDEEIASVTAYSKIMPVFAFVHMGTEYTADATPTQKQTGRDMIDAGADFVIMNHPHWVQGTEVYKGKLIAHSTGNFFYDQLTYEELRSASIDVEMTLPYDANLAAWVAYAKTCDPKKLHDTCYADAPASLSRVDTSYLFDMVAGDARAPFRWQARKADEVLQKDTEGRTNWQQTLKDLKQTQRLN